MGESRSSIDETNIRMIPIDLGDVCKYVNNDWGTVAFYFMKEALYRSDFTDKHELYRQQ